MTAPSFTVELPLYSVSCYRDNLFRVVKRCFTPSGVSRGQTKEPQSYETKCASSCYRARTVVREYALCNDWPYFCTFTFDKRKIDRYGLKHIVEVLMQWLANMRKRHYPQLRYLLIPEPHKDGAWHFHGFMAGVPLSPLPDWAPRDLLEGGYQEWTDFRLRFGWCSFSEVRSAEAVAFYVTKYITKNLFSNAVPVGVHLHYQSHGLRRSLKVGDLYHESPLLNRLLKTDGRFYRSGFFSLEDGGFDDFGSLVDVCDEVGPMYRSFVIEDGELPEAPVALMGGDFSDEEFQVVMSAFSSSGLSCRAFEPEPDSGGPVNSTNSAG